MLVTFGICFKQHFDTRYLVFYNPSPPRMFLSLDLLWQYRIQHSANGPLYVTSSYSTWIFCRGVSGFATDCPCGVWCRGLTTCLLHVGPPFGNRILTQWGRVTHICVSKLTIIGSDNGLVPDRRQAIIWSNAGILLIGPIGTNFIENLIEILTFSFTKMRLKVSSAKWRLFGLGLNELNNSWAVGLT